MAYFDGAAGQGFNSSVGGPRNLCSSGAALAIRGTADPSKYQSRS